MSRKHLRQHWTEEEVKAAIAKVLADEPDGTEQGVLDERSHHPGGEGDTA